MTYPNRVYYIQIQDALSEGVTAIMNKEGDKRVYFSFWYVHIKYAGLGPFKMYPSFLK